MAEIFLSVGYSGLPLRQLPIYARVSAAEQNVGVQLEELRKAVSQGGWRLHGEYVDEGVSGAETQR